MASTRLQECLDNALIILNRKEVRLIDLETENAKLRAEIARFRHLADSSGKSGGDSPLDKTAQLTSELVAHVLAKNETLTWECKDLATSHRDLEARLARSRAYVDHATKKYNAAKEVTKKWKEWYERHQKQPVAEAPLPDSNDAHGSEEMQTTPRAVQAAPEAQAAPEPVAGGESLSNDRSTSHPEQASEHQCDEDRPHRDPISSHTAQVTSSQTTELGSDPPGPNPMKRAISSDDEPVIVSARPVKRSRRSNPEPLMPLPVHIKQDPSLERRVIELESEAYSSPVICHKELARKETSDLDALAEAIITPRKHRRQQVKQERAISEEARSLPKLTPRVSSLSEPDTAETADDRARVKQEPLFSTSSRMMKHRHLPASKPDLSERDPGRDPQADALRPISGNALARSHPENLYSPVKQRPRDEDRWTKIRGLAEDGEDGVKSKPADAPETTALQVTPMTVVRRRLGEILDEPSPNKLPLNKAQVTDVLTPRPPEYSPPKQARSPRTVMRSSRSARKPAENKARPPVDAEASPPPVEPDDEPVRHKPLNALTLEDFRVNPKYMGSDYAFADTLRGRDQRRCLPGCTNPECCGGTFRKVIEMGGGAELTGQSDAEVLEAYLGPDWPAVASAYAPAQRRELLAQARAHAFARQFGKHRDAFQRRSTPPGFWRTEMPTTQEALEDRAQAAEMERRKIEERRREALREKGRWKFKDE